MTVLLEAESHQFPGNGSADEFDFEFLIFDSDELVAQLITDATGEAALLVDEIDYTVSVSATGGTVTTSVPVPIGYTLDLRPIYELLQTTSIKNQGTFRPEVHERVMDRLASQQQYLRRLIGAAVRAPDYEPSLDLILPPVSARAGMYSAFDALGKPVASSGTGADAGLRTDLASAVAGDDGSRLSGYRRDANATATSVGEVLARVVYLDDYGPDRNGPGDSSSAFEKAIDALPDTGGEIVITPGKYFANFAVTKPGVKIRGAGRYYESNDVGIFPFSASAWTIDVGGTDSRLGDFGLDGINVHGDEIGELGVRLRNCDHYKLFRTSIRGFRVMAAQIYGTTGQASTYGNLTDSSIATCDVVGAIGLQIKADAGSYVIPVRMNGVDLHSTGASSYVLDIDNTGGQGILVEWGGVWCECGHNRGVRMKGLGAEIIGFGDIDSSSSSDSLVNIDTNAFVSDFIRGNIRIDGVVTMPAGDTFAISGKAHMQNESFLTHPHVQGALNFQDGSLAGRLQTATGAQTTRISRSGNSLFVAATNGSVFATTGGTSGAGSDAFTLQRQDGSDAKIKFQGTGILIVTCVGSPEGAVTAPPGSIALRTNGGAGTGHYVKESGTGNTGWVAK
jgi:hypothetical protein